MNKDEARERARKLAAKFADRGDHMGWFDEFYQMAGGNTDNIPWADLEPNPFLVRWADAEDLTGNARSALVVGCGLGDDARFLRDRGFEVTAFDISPTAIDWARRVEANPHIRYETADLFSPPLAWVGAFEFVLEVYTIQPLPMELRPKVIEAIARFVAPGGKIVIVTRGREDDEEPVELPWPLSRTDLSHFERVGLQRVGFTEMTDDKGEKRFVVEYRQPGE